MSCIHFLQGHIESFNTLSFTVFLRHPELLQKLDMLLKLLYMLRIITAFYRFFRDASKVGIYYCILFKYLFIFVKSFAVWQNLAILATYARLFYNYSHCIIQTFLQNSIKSFNAL